ncbi:MAG: aspartate aminotransferase family protein [Coriobacteriia bacterium]|nr:aspartate aminotransferase family protein [Coriobacteriia bacterium]
MSNFEVNNQKSVELIQAEKPYASSYSRVSYYDAVFDHGKGALLYDVDGNEYIDFLASASSCNTGHCHPKVVKAVQEQAEKLIQTTPAYMWHEPQIRLMERLAKLAPGNSPKRVSFGNSGSDAADAVLKLARAYTGRPYMVSFEGSYHGSTYGSLTLSALSLNMRRKMGPLVPGIYHIPYPDVYHNDVSGMDDEQIADHFMKPLLDMTSHYLPKEEIAGIFIEAVAGDLGIVPAHKRFMEKLYDFCQENGILFCVDEVNQGLGRTGKMWSIDHYGIEPDLMTCAKSLASGLPLSAVIGKADILQSLGAPANLFTTAGNPVTTAASLATLDVIEEEDLPGRSERLGKHARERFEEMKEKYGVVSHVFGLGLNLGVEICDPETGEKDTAAALKISTRAHQKGLVLITLNGSVLRVQPPLVITEEQLDKGLDIIDSCMQELVEGKLPDDLVKGDRGW